MDDLIAFLRARLDELEFSDWHARDCKTHQRMPANSPLGQAGKPMTCNCPVPEWLLAEVDAKRRILDLHHPDKHLENWYWDSRKCAECGHLWHRMTEPGTPPTVIGPETGCATVRLLALPYADHPDYREEWRL